MKLSEAEQLTDILTHAFQMGLQVQGEWVVDRDQNRMFITDSCRVSFKINGQEESMCRGEKDLVNLYTRKLGAAMTNMAHEYIKRAAHILEVVGEK